MSSRPRGYSLVEFAVAMAISGIIAVAAVSVFPVLNQSVVQARNTTIIDAQMQPVLETLHADLQETGGGGLSGSDSVVVYPRLSAAGTELDGSDALLMMGADLAEPTCTITAYADDVSMTAVRNNEGGVATADCCYPAGPVNRLAAARVSGAMQLVVMKASAASCVVTIDNVLVRPALGTGAGLVTVVNVKYLYLDGAAHELVASVWEPRVGLMVDHAPDTEAPSDLFLSSLPRFRHVVARDVYDFQLATARDADGLGIEETADGVDDGWVGNAAADVVDHDVVHYVRLGLMLGAKTKGTDRPSLTLLDGPARSETDRLLFGTAITAFLRNGTHVR